MNKLSFSNVQISYALGIVVAILTVVLNYLQTTPSALITVGGISAAVISAVVNYITTKQAAPVVAVVPAPVKETTEVPAAITETK